MTTPDWMIALFLLAMALALAAICFRLGKSWADSDLQEQASLARQLFLEAKDDLCREREAHTMTVLRASDAEERLSQISLLAAPKAE